MDKIILNMSRTLILTWKMDGFIPLGRRAACNERSLWVSDCLKWLGKVCPETIQPLLV